MKQNPIEDVLEELKFTKEEKDGFMKFLSHAKTCQETGNNQQLKQYLENIIAKVVERG